MQTQAPWTGWRRVALPALAVAAIVAAAPVARADGPDHFPLDPGASWTYELTVTEQTGEGEEGGAERKLNLSVRVRPEEEQVGEKACKVVEYKADDDVVQVEYYYVENDKLFCPRRVHAQSAFDFEPHQAALPTTLAAGADWSWEGKVGIFDGKSTFKVAGATEKVTVKAGTFDALLVELTFEGGDGSKGTTKRWYAKGVGIVKEEGTIETYGEKIVSKGELVEYQAAGAAPNGGAGGGKEFWKPGSGDPVEVSIASPTDGATLDTDTVEAKFTLKNYWIEKPHQHIHVILDNEPYAAHYDIDGATVFEGLSEGTHTIRFFPARAKPILHQSVKDPGAFGVVTFHVKSKTKEPLSLEGSKLLTYSRPKGTYEGDAAKKILLDFWVTGTQLAADGDHVRYKVDDGEWKMVTAWGNEVEPIFLEGLAPGKHKVTLELVDKDGAPIPGPAGYEDYNQTTREIEVK